MADGEIGYETGPYIGMAVFCETVLHEVDGVTSLIRILDTMDVCAEGPDSPDELPPGVVEVNLVVLLRAGRALGAQTLRVDLERPDGSRDLGPEMAIHFPPGEAGGHRIDAPIKFEARSAGLYWADVFVNDRLMTRAPLTIRYGFRRDPRP